MFEIHIKMIQNQYITFIIGIVVGIIGYELWCKWDDMRTPKEDSK